MNTKQQTVSATCRRRLEIQGYLNFTDSELSEHRFGIRFAYWICTLLAFLGVVTANLWILWGVALLALFATLPPYHPIDYLYNYGFRHILGKSKLPPRSRQGRFACGIAVVWLAATIYFITNGQMVIAYAFGFTLIVVGILVSLVDICIPSMLYNFLFHVNKSNQKKESVKQI